MREEGGQGNSTCDLQEAVFSRQASFLFAAWFLFRIASFLGAAELEVLFFPFDGFKMRSYYCCLWDWGSLLTIAGLLLFDDR